MKRERDRENIFHRTILRMMKMREQRKSYWQCHHLGKLYRRLLNNGTLSRSVALFMFYGLNWRLIRGELREKKITSKVKVNTTDVN